MSLCDDVRAHLPLFVGGDLEPPLARRVLDHLGLEPASLESPPGPDGDPDGEVGRDEIAPEGSGCAGCRHLLAGLQRARGALQGLPVRSPAPPVDVWAPIQAALRAEGLVPAPRLGRVGGRLVGSASGARGRGRLLARGWGSLAAAAAVLVSVGGLYFALQPGGDLEPLGAPGGVPGAEPGRIAEREGSGPATGLESLVVPASDGRLRPLNPGEVPLGERALPLVDGLRGWQFGQPWPGYPGASVDPSRPTFASDRSLR